MPDVTASGPHGPVGPSSTDGLAYLVCCTPRSGSWLVTEGLARTGVAGVPDEYFSQERELEFAGEPLPPVEVAVPLWLSAVARKGRTPNGVVGLKAHLEQLEHLFFRLAMMPSVPKHSMREALESYLPPVTMVWTRRRDKVRQTVSWWRALQTGIWFAIDGRPQQPRQEPVFDAAAMGGLHRRLVVQEATWCDFFAAYGATPIVLDYEDVEQHYSAAIVDVLGRLGLPVPIDGVVRRPRLNKQADELSEDWVERLRPLVTEPPALRLRR